mmetsp:Transcript_15340/g.20507  ORF Transcript_15340/g.20507 Transcript_15340/m.20507 type:complete len:333 (-) Transcript_15340:1239-2237(-)
MIPLRQIHAQRISIPHIPPHQIHFGKPIPTLPMYIQRIDAGIPHSHGLGVPASHASVADAFEARPGARHGHDVGLGVGVEGLRGGGVKLGGAVVVQLVQAYGEELHDLARIVLIRQHGRTVVLDLVLQAQIAVEAEPHGHDIRVANLLQYIPVTPKGVPHKDVVVTQEHLRLVIFDGDPYGYDLVQRPRHPLAELIARFQRNVDPHAIPVFKVVPLPVQHAALGRAGHGIPVVSEGEVVGHFAMLAAHHHPRPSLLDAVGSRERNIFVVGARIGGGGQLASVLVEEVPGHVGALDVIQFAPIHPGDFRHVTPGFHLDRSPPVLQGVVDGVVI